MSELLGRNAILAAQDRREELVDVPEWGGKVRLLTLVGDDRVAFERLARQHSKGEITPTEFAADAAMLAIVDQDGTRIFTTQEHRKQLLGKNSVALQRVLAVTFRLSKPTQEAVDDELGESSGDPIGSSASDSA